MCVPFGAEFEQLQIIDENLQLGLDLQFYSINATDASFGSKKYSKF